MLPGSPPVNSINSSSATAPDNQTPQIGPTSAESQAAADSSTLVASPEPSSSPHALNPDSGIQFRRQGSRSSTSNGFFSPVTSPPRQISFNSSNDASQQTSNPPDSSNSFVKAYIDQSRTLLDQQRRVFDQERSLFDQERALWDTERKTLYARIKELESAGGDVAGRKSSRPSLDSMTRHGVSRQDISGSGSVSRGPSRQSSLGETGDKFWEGSSSRQGSVVSRTFNAPHSDDSRLPSISENESKADMPRDSDASSNALSPNAAPPETAKTLVGTGIDISVLRKDLDGISLKPSAVPPSIVAQVQSPSPLQSPPPTGVSTDPTRGLSGPTLSDDNLTKHAGHTPNASRNFDAESRASETATPTQTRHPQHPQHPHQSSAATRGAHGESGAPLLDDDPELQGPLALDGDGAENSQFLNTLDAKLLQEARKVVHAPPSDASSVSDEAIDDKDQGGSLIRQPEPDIRLKLRRSMNFGSAFGVRAVGST